MNGTIDEYKYRLFHNHLDLVQQSVGAGSDIPLNEDYLIQDSRDIERMKNEFLWKFKGSPEKKRLRKQKKEVKDKLMLATPQEADLVIAVNKFIIEPIENTVKDAKLVPALYPDKDLYEKFTNKEIPFTVLRSKYIDFLNSERGTKLVMSLRKGVLQHGEVVLIGDTELKKVLKEEVLNSFGV